VAAAFALYAVLAACMFSSAWIGGASRSAGVPGDPQAELWYLSWVLAALRHGWNPLVSDHLGFPGGVNLMWNNANAVPLLGMVLAPVTAGFGALTSVNLMAYGVSSYMVAQSLGHFGLTFAPIPPLMLLVLDALLIRDRRSPIVLGIALGTLAAAQLLIAEELLAGEGVAGVVVLIVLVVLAHRYVRGRLVRAAVGLLVAAVTFAILGALPLGVQFLGPGVVDGQIRPPDVFVNDLLNLVVPTSFQLVHNEWTDVVTSVFTGNPSEWNGYIGVPLLGVLVAAMVRGRRALLVRVTAVAAVILATISLGPHLHVGGRVTGIPLLWQVDGVPLLSQLLPSRMMLYFFLAAAILVALYTDGLAARIAAGGGRRWRAVPGVGLMVLAALSLLPLWPWPSTSVDVPPFFTSDQVRRIPEGSVVLIAPFSRYTSGTMVWQAAAGMRFRIPDGNYVGADGPAFQGPAPRVISSTLEAIQAGGPPPFLDPVLRRMLADDLTSLDVQTVLVGPMDHRAEMVTFLRDLYQRGPLDTGGVQMWRGLPPS